MTAREPALETPPELVDDLEDAPAVGLVDLLAWIGGEKRLIGGVTLAVGAIALAAALLLPNVFTARASLLAPGAQQQGGGSAAALLALGSLGGLAGGMAAKTPDELYVALLKSDTVQRALAQRFELGNRWEKETYEQLRSAFPGYVRISSDKKSGLISVEVDDREPAFAARLANGFAEEIAKLMDRLAVSEAQARRVFFEQQLKDTKENLVAAELGLRKMQESTGVVVLEKQAEALIVGAAQLRAQIAEREVMLSVLRRSATAQNPDVQRLGAEVSALRNELARMESSQAGERASPLDLRVNKLSEAGIEYLRAVRELKLQEALLETMIRQYELAKLDEAKEGQVLQQVDIAQPPDRKSKPVRSLIVGGSVLVAFLVMCAWAVWRGYRARELETDPDAGADWRRVGQAWRLRR